MKNRIMLFVGMLALTLGACAEPNAPQLSAPAALSKAVIINADGTGWVGKGDVQTAFAWNNKVMQDRHTQVSFQYDNSVTYTFACEWTTGEGTRGEKQHVQTKTVTTGVQAAVGSLDRKTGQWTGWFLSGIPSGGAVAEPDCSGNEAGDGFSGEKTVVEGSLVILSQGGGLYAVFRRNNWL